MHPFYFPLSYPPVFPIHSTSISFISSHCWLLIVVILNLPLMPALISPFRDSSSFRFLIPTFFNSIRPQRKAAEKAAPKAKAVKGKKDKNAPKRALSAYMFFSQDWRERIKAENPDAGFGTSIMSTPVVGG
jgi:hypothetical protein